MIEAVRSNRRSVVEVLLAGLEGRNLSDTVIFYVINLCVVVPVSLLVTKARGIGIWPFLPSAVVLTSVLEMCLAQVYRYANSKHAHVTPAVLSSPAFSRFEPAFSFGGVDIDTQSDSQPESPNEANVYFELRQVRSAILAESERQSAALRDVTQSLAAQARSVDELMDGLREAGTALNQALQVIVELKQVRFHELVDRKLLETITNSERAELELLTEWYDARKAEFYRQPADEQGKD